MEFESITPYFITYYFFDEYWNSNPLLTTFLMSNGIRIHYPLFFWGVMEFESIAHYYSNE